MRIEETRIFDMYLSDEEFELLHEICGESVDYGYVNINGHWMIKLLSEQMIDKIEELLEHARNYQLYEECNRAKADRIRDLMLDLTYEMSNLDF